QPTYLFAVVWLVVMMLPSALTAEGIPNSLRNLAAAPVVYILPALALVQIGIAIQSRYRMQDAGRATRRSHITHSALRVYLASCIIFLLLALQAGLTYHDYFVSWAEHPETAKAMNADMHVVEIAEWMNAHADENNAFLLLNTYEHPAIAFLYTGESPYASLPDGGDVPATIRQLCQGRSRLLVIQWYGLNPGAMRAENFALDMLDAYAMRAGEQAASRGFSVLAYQLPLDLLFPMRLRDRAAKFGGVQFGDAAHLTGYLFHTPSLGPDTVTPGAEAWVVLRWQLPEMSDGDTPPALKVTLRLLDAEGRAVAQLDKALTGPESEHREARPGDAITDYYRLSIPADVPPGTCTLVMGVYLPDTLQLLPVVSDAVVSDGQTDVLLTLGLITIREEKP
ncbi:MAG: hypothetical protein KJ734_08955, partial [Chloroflexi bacterium]|nr:hypothetical protein [Chloroflexota bacterium]